MKNINRRGGTSINTKCAQPLPSVGAIVHPTLFDEHIRKASTSKLKAYSLHDISGKVLQQGQITGGEANIDARFVSSGIYIMLIDTEHGTASQKVIKE